MMKMTDTLGKTYTEQELDGLNDLREDAIARAYAALVEQQAQCSHTYRRSEHQPPSYHGTDYTCTKCGKRRHIR